MVNMGEHKSKVSAVYKIQFFAVKSSQQGLFLCDDQYKG